LPELAFKLLQRPDLYKNLKLHKRKPQQDVLRDSGIEKEGS
jgi:hypothetical protein